MTTKTLSIALLIGVAFSVFSYFVLDVSVAKFALVREDPVTHSDEAIVFWRLVTEMGDSAWMGILLAIIWVDTFIMGKFRPQNPLWPTLRNRAAYVFGAVLISGIGVLIVKAIVGRARPYKVEATTGEMFFNPLSLASDFASWPSGHTTTAFAFAAAVGLLYPRSRWLLFPLAALTAYSRMALGVHYLGDVVMGAIWGTVCAILVFHWLRPKLKLKP